MLLCVFIPINAKGTAYVYKMTEADTGLSSSDGGNSWQSYKESEAGYIVVEPNDNNTASICHIKTWTQNGTKYYAQDNTVTFEFLQVLVGKNTMWIATYADDVNGGQSIMLSGTIKPVKIGTTKLPIAATLTGTTLWLDEEDTYIDVGEGKTSLSLNTPLTTYGYANSGEDTVTYVIHYLANLNYQPGSD